MEFIEISKAKLEKSDFLWRYIDLHKLIDLAVNKELHFTRTDKFPDPFEGVTYKLIDKRFIAMISNITNPSIEKKIRDEQNKKNKLTLENYEKESLTKQKTQFINCWIKSDRESIAMWNIYSNRNSIALKARPRDLIDYFKKNLELQPLYLPKSKFVCGSITYCRLNPIDLNEKPTLPLYSSFKKDVAYDFEKEFRLLIATPALKAKSNPEFLRYSISQNFIELIEIICHPEMEQWKFDNLKRICEILKLPNPNKSKTEIRI